MRALIARDLGVVNGESLHRGSRRSLSTASLRVAKKDFMPS